MVNKKGATIPSKRMRIDIKRAIFKMLLRKLLHNFYTVRYIVKMKWYLFKVIVIEAVTLISARTLEHTHM